jgi:hypothetical protein
MIRQQNTRSRDISPKSRNILFYELPALLVDIITPTIEAAPEFRIVGNVGREESLLEAVQRTEADIIIATESIVAREEYVDIFYARRSLKVVEIMSNGLYGAIYELRPRRVHLGELSQPWLLNVLRVPTGHSSVH